MGEASRRVQTGRHELRLTRASLRQGSLELARRDRKLGDWIDRIGHVTLRRQRPYFVALSRSIVSQQIGARAAASIYARFAALFPSGRPRADALFGLSDQVLRTTGLSRQKVRYLRELAAAFTEGGLGRLRLARLDDDEVIRRLTQIPGVGVWTAEMFLIFSLGRLDVFSVGDLALRTAVQRVEGRELSAGEIATVAARWSPYRSVACLYLWKVAHWPDEQPKRTPQRKIAKS